MLLTHNELLRLASDPGELAARLATLQTNDIAGLLDELPPAAAARVIMAMPFELAVEIFDVPSFERRHEVFHHLDERVAAPLLEAMASDEQAAVIREMSDAERTQILRRLDRSAQNELALLLSFPADTAGGIMSTEFVSVPSSWTVDQALRHIREVGRAKETVYAIYIVDASGRLLHVVSLRELLVSERQLPVSHAGPGKVPLTVAPFLDREQVALTIARYDLLAIPVVDDAGKILGIVTVDDVIDVLIEEETEDLQKLGGLAALDEPYLEAGLGTMLRKRGGWLAVLFLGETLTATAMGFFEAEIAAAVVLALFIPLIISSGGNSGSQTTTLIIRAMALGQVRLRDWWRVVRRELVVGLALGLLLGVLGFLRIVVWQHVYRFTHGIEFYGEHYLLVALTILLSLVGVVTWGTMVGSMLPFILRRLGFDPASASAPFVATLVDVTGIIIYFSVAAVILRGTLL
jgi:magnesium transporter